MEDELPTTHIQYRELLPLAHAAEHLGALWANQIVRFLYIFLTFSSILFAIPEYSQPISQKDNVYYDMTGLLLKKKVELGHTLSNEVNFSSYFGLRVFRRATTL